MTVIAWDGKSIAADKMSARGDLISTVTKMVEGRDGYFVATCGSTIKGLILIDWFNDGAKKEDLPDFQKTDDWVWLIAAKKGELLIYCQEHKPMTIEDQFCAWGSGCEFAIGAMSAGATAYQAVEIASKHCGTCGQGVDVFRLD